MGIRGGEVTADLPLARTGASPWSQHGSPVVLHCNL